MTWPCLDLRSFLSVYPCIAGTFMDYNSKRKHFNEERSHEKGRGREERDGHNSVIRAAELGRTALRNRGKGVISRAAEPVRISSRVYHHHHGAGDSHTAEPSSPSARLFHRISMSLKERQCDPENGVHYCDLVESSCYNKVCACEEDMECWRHGNFKMSPPNPSYMSHAASSLITGDDVTPS